MIIFREAEIDDVANIVQIMASNDIGSKREDLANLEPYIGAFNEIRKSDNNYLIVMCDDTNVIGTFHLTITPYLALQGSKRATIESVHIDRSLRSGGFGTQMMEYAINLAKEKGAKIVQLTTNKGRIDAKRFYEKLGFVATHEGMKLKI
jgi:ribosomal protein S18 acetylase RimI-like enzyme